MGVLVSLGVLGWSQAVIRRIAESIFKNPGGIIYGWWDLATSLDTVGEGSGKGICRDYIRFAI
jgi:hypothetical protein